MYLPKKRNNALLSGKDYNLLVNEIETLKKLTFQVPGGKISQGNSGTQLTINVAQLYKGMLQSAAAGTSIAEVDSNATGGGYYNCHIQTLDATDWNAVTVDHWDDVGDSVVVQNVPECPETDDTTSH